MGVCIILWITFHCGCTLALLSIFLVQITPDLAPGSSFSFLLSSSDTLSSCVGLLVGVCFGFVFPWFWFCCLLSDGISLLLGMTGELRLSWCISSPSPKDHCFLQKPSFCSLEAGVGDRGPGAGCARRYEGAAARSRPRLTEPGNQARALTAASVCLCLFPRAHSCIWIKANVFNAEPSPLGSSSLISLLIRKLLSISEEPGSHHPPPIYRTVQVLQACVLVSDLLTCTPPPPTPGNQL